MLSKETRLKAKAMLRRILKKARSFFRLAVNCNIVLAVKIVVIPYFLKNRSASELNEYKHNAKKRYLKNKYKSLIKAFRERRNEVDSDRSRDYPIWFLWWQGKEQMPPLVKACYQTLEYYSNGHVVNLVTGDNYNNFVDIPDYILKKLERRQISTTHFSDVLRMCLLFEHGGLWVDSTVLLTRPLPDLPGICSHLGFWTPKDNGDILETCFGARNWVVREDKWMTFCLYASKHNILTEFVRKMFFAYLKKTSFFVDYFLFDYFISIAYDVISDVRVMIDSVPPNNPRIHEIQHRLYMNYEYNKTLFDDMCKDTFFHKLTWKDTFKEYTANGKLTNYGYIINNFPPK